VVGFGVRGQPVSSLGVSRGVTATSRVVRIKLLFGHFTAGEISIGIYADWVEAQVAVRAVQNLADAQRVIRFVLQ